MPRIFMIYILIIIGLLIDQITKLLARAYLIEDIPVSVIKGLFDLNLTKNHGVALSILSGQRWIIIALTIFIMAGLMFFYFKQEKRSAWLTIGVAMTFCGGIGNIIDRIFLGYVTDMLSISFFPPIFNVADIYVTLGCMIIGACIIFEEEKDHGNL